MTITKRVLNLKVMDDAHMIDLMKELSTFKLDLEAESKHGSVKVVAHGDAEEIKKLELKMKKLLFQNTNKRKAKVKKR
ncbi:MAG: hypothetical protein DRN83_01380 [Hadesarchaea archaeon]|nr:MAG: hypothetical protein DRN83_01380 [Hadesarchaea archaeon]HDI13061.1 hypothetical protein [Hadesarchaea archaeon]